MPSLMMGHLWGTVVPADEATVRRTAVPVVHDKPAAMATDMPVMGEVETDHDPNLGLVNRQVASKWFEGEQGVPAWAPRVADQYEHNAIVDRQVSTAGYSAHQEAEGNWGHGTMKFAVGIEPTSDLTDGGQLGNDYFTVHPKPIQSTADDTMMSTTVSPDPNTTAAGKVNARRAAQAALYNKFWNSGQ